MGRTFWIETLGCKANTYDSVVARGELVREGWRPAARGERADLVIVNSCTVTDEADRQSRAAARRLARRHPDAAVVVTGCAAEVGPGSMAEEPGVRLVVGNTDKRDLVQRAMAEVRASGSKEGDEEARAKAQRRKGAPSRSAADTGRVLAADPGASLGAFAPLRDTLAFPAAETVARTRTRAVLKVQDGCDAFCTYCIIPAARGPSRSIPADRLVDDVRRLVDEGVREVVLTGIAIGDWRDGAGGEAHDPARDGYDPVTALVARLLADTDIEGVRLGSLEPPEITPALLALMRDEPRLRPHLHVSLQSPDGALLKRMGRRYGADAVDACLERVAALGEALGTRQGLVGGVYVGMDVIAGFPGEDEAAFARVAARLEALPWTRLHVFPYSERAGTAATRLRGSVPEPTRKARVKALMALSNARQAAVADAIVGAAAPLPVLVERPPSAARVRAVVGDADGVWLRGRTPNYHEVLFAVGDQAEAERLWNTVARVRPVRRALVAGAGQVVLVGARVAL